MANTLKTASVLAFERKLDNTDALFYAGNWNNHEKIKEWPPVVIREKSVRGTISNRLSAKDQDPAKIDAKIEKPNLQTVDVATLPVDADTLGIRFTLRVSGNIGEPSACNNVDYQQKLQQTVKQYVEKYSFDELAKRYAMNLANGRFLWRNRLGAEQIQIKVNQLKMGSIQKQWSFDALVFDVRDFSVPEQYTASINELTEVIKLGLLGELFVLLEIIAYVRVGEGQEVFPSQELILDTGSNNNKGSKSKTLYTVGTTAAMHSQKVGNALRTIDSWYPDSHTLGPIAVEPYGAVTSKGKAYRQPKQKVDFYTLLDNWIRRDKIPENEGDQHFVIATLIRGGVFGEKE
ncbi:type I-F CRISPR-associated protein Csy3 [Zooshikella ganghwensis]|uniref:Type I-F CRISPR-associated protein Csy3 n=1 Tax=Zooshikella ganghwensis TaxID=202772 RepID=A0A4P9VMR3_9GAMM|nr:type I-F CRISPR-associated protein Csy3 [Zooshikella ganghwensis]RDH43677.1 type I-F CRISPR-associated protein Csy3 [Zooshikella ganghwensis]